MKLFIISSLLGIIHLCWGVQDNGRKYVRQPIRQRLENAIKLHKDDQGKSVIDPASLALLRGSSTTGNHLLTHRQIRTVRGTRSFVSKHGAVPCPQRKSKIQERAAKRVFNTSYSLDAPFTFTVPTTSSPLDDVLCPNVAGIPATVVLQVTPAPTTPTVATPKPTTAASKPTAATSKATAATVQPAVAAANAAAAAKTAAKSKAVQAAQKAVAAAKTAAAKAVAQAQAAVNAKKAAAAKAAAAKKAASVANAAAAAQAQAAAKAVAVAKAAAAKKKAAAAQAQATKKAAAAAQATTAAKKATAAKAAATANAAAAAAKAKAAQNAAKAAKATSAAKTAAKIQTQAAVAKAVAAANAAKVKAANAAKAAAGAKAAVAAKATAAAKTVAAANSANAAKTQAAAKAAVANTNAAVAKQAAVASKAAAQAQAAKAAQAAAAAKNAGKPTLPPTTPLVVTSPTSSPTAGLSSKPTISTPAVTGAAVTTPPTVATTSKPAVTGPVTNKPGSPVRSFNAVVRLPSAAYKPALNNKQSPQFKALATTLCSKVKSAVKAGKAITQCRVQSFRPGSLLVDFYLKFLSTIPNPVQLFLNVIKTGFIGGIPVDKLPKRLYNGTGVQFPPGFSGCKPVTCPHICLPPICSTACRTGIQCATAPTGKPSVPKPAVLPTVPEITYVYPPIYMPAPPVSYPIRQQAPAGPAPCPMQCLQHTPQYCPSYCAKRCCTGGLPPSNNAGKNSGVKRPAKAEPSHRLVLKTKRTRIHHGA